MVGGKLTRAGACMDLTNCTGAECYIVRGDPAGDWVWSVLDGDAQVLRSGRSGSQQCAAAEALMTFTAPDAEACVSRAEQAY